MLSATRRAAASASRLVMPGSASRMMLPPLAHFYAAARAPHNAPHELRRPFKQKNRRRDDQLLPRMEPAIPSTDAPFVQAWLSSWSEPRAGIAKLRADMWAMPLRTDIVHRCVIWQRACMRQGTAKTKHRHEVHGGGKKPWAQKKTGRARHGSIRSPLWVGGGHAHPKRPRDFGTKLNRKITSLGMRTALSDKYRRNALVVLRDLELESDAPEALEARLSAMGINLEKQRVMIIARSGEAPVPFKPRQPKRLPQDWSGGSPDSNLIAAAGRYRQGLRPVNAFTARDVTVLDLCKHSLLVVSLDSLAELHSLHLRPWNTGHAWAPLGPPEFGSMSGRVAEVGEDGSAVEMGQS